jgi:hypothetical protein
MRLLQGFRFSIGTLMMFVVAAGAGSALYVKAGLHTGASGVAGLKTDVPVLLLLAIGLTTVSLGAWKDHSVVQMLLQGTLACLGCLALIGMSEAGLARAVRYWLQGTFAVTVMLPLLGRRYVKARLPSGPRREWWKKTCEAIIFSFLGLLCVSVGGFIQLMVTAVLYDFLKI